VPAFQRFLDTGRPPGLFRGKGLLWLAETDARYVFHLVGERCAIEIDPACRDPENRLVFIGRGFDPAGLHKTLVSCLAVEPALAIAKT
jgi:G3E family GTPase